MLGDQDVRVAVAGQVHEAQVGVLPVDGGQGLEGPELGPARVLGALEEARHRGVEGDQVELAVAGEIEQLLSAALQCGWLGLARDPDQRAEPALPEVALVVPAFRLLGEDAGHPLAVEVHPAIGGAIQPLRQVLQAFGVELANGLVDLGTAVLERQGRQRFLEVTTVATPVAALGDGCDE